MEPRMIGGDAGEEEQRHALMMPGMGGSGAPSLLPMHLMAGAGLGHHQHPHAHPHSHVHAHARGHGHGEAGGRHGMGMHGLLPLHGEAMSTEGEEGGEGQHMHGLLRGADGSHISVSAPMPPALSSDMNAQDGAHAHGGGHRRGDRKDMERGGGGGRSYDGEETEEDEDDDELSSSTSSAPATGKKRKRFNKFRNVRAHVNPLSNNRFPGTPVSPSDLRCRDLFPGMHVAADTQVEFADVGCGFGGLLVSLAPLFPATLMLGLEIRDRAVDYVNDRIRALRTQHQSFKQMGDTHDERMAAFQKTLNPGQPRWDGDPAFHFENIHALRCNAMKYFPCYFRKGQLSKLFFLFPDPHFKKTNHRRRIINTYLLAEYAFALREGGMLYTITDVLDLHQWMVKHLDAHPLFERIPDAALTADKAFQVIFSGTDEGLKVDRAQGDKYPAVYRRIAHPAHGRGDMAAARSLV